MPAAARTADPTVQMPSGNEPPIPVGVIVPPGELTVLIGSRAAARLGDTTAGPSGPDPIMTGSPTVFIGSQPAARAGDLTVQGTMVGPGCPSVLIGGVGGGGGGGAAGGGAGGGGGGGAGGPTACSPGDGRDAFHASPRQRGPSGSEVARQREVLRDAARDGTPFAELCAPREAMSDDDSGEGASEGASGT